MGEDLAIVWIIVGFFGVIIGLRIFFGLRKEKRRREELTAAAGALGARFEPKPDTGFVQEIRTHFFVFRFFRKRCVTNLIERSVADATLRLFDYAYFQTGSRVPTYWSIVLASSPNLELPKFMMGDHGGALRVRDKIKRDPIVFSDKSFNEAHQVHAEDAPAVEAVFTENLQSFFAGRPDLGMEGSGAHFLLFVPGRIVAPEEIRSWMHDAEFVLKEVRQG